MSRSPQQNTGSSRGAAIEGQGASRNEITLSTETWNHLLDQEWYHGLMPRGEIEELLTKEGDFLVRKSDINGKVLLPLSVHDGDEVLHFVLKCDKGLWWISDPERKRESLDELLDDYIQTKAPLRPGGPVLKQFIRRPSYCFRHDQVQLQVNLSEGAMGEVWSATLHLGDIDVDCTVKTLKEVASKQERINFIKEAMLLRTFHHTNIVRTYGVAAQKEPLMIILEPNSAYSLKSYLQETAVEVDTMTLTAFCRDAAKGMLYLASQRVLHRDIAARNCLLGLQNSLKIGNFGLAVELPNEEETIKADESMKISVRWQAPETILTQEFSLKTEVWSYGVLIWEIFSKCSSDPYPGMTVEQVLIQVVGGSDSLEPPEEMPSQERTVMRLCFMREPKDRPTFGALLALLS